jgi:hypothetical protein
MIQLQLFARSHPRNFLFDPIDLGRFPHGLRAIYWMGGGSLAVPGRQTFHVRLSIILP